jgi:uncharacterized membrane protein
MNTLNQLLSTLSLPWIDLAALAWFAAWWMGYVRYTDYREIRQPTLRRQMDKFIRQWLARMVERENRMLDVNVIRNLSRASQFFASTTMLILGALVALMGYAEQAAGVLAELPFTQQVSERVWELKILLLILIFVYAFFKFSWSIRQYGMGTILVGATYKVPDEAEHYAPHIDRVATVVSFASGNFNNGLRSYYFGVAALSWFLHPVLMMIFTVGVVYVLYQREFRSKTLQALIGG